MPEYIEREETCKDCLHFDVCQEVENLKCRKDFIWYQAKSGCPHFKHAADVVEVRHAQFKWGYQNGQYGIWCTDCGAGWVDSENAEWIAREHNYCPNCGAKTDGKGENDG